MANWCSTDITIYGKENTIKYLYKELENATNKNYSNNDIGTTWLGNIVEYLGKNHENVNCRGYINYMEKYDDHIFISTETAWVPMLRPILMLIEHLGIQDSVEFIYSSIESGCGLYITNDPATVGFYLVENASGDEIDGPIAIWDYAYVSEQELKNAICIALNKDEDKKIDDLISDLQNTYEDIYIHQFEYCNEHEL